MGKKGGEGREGSAGKPLVQNVAISFSEGIAQGCFAKKSKLQPLRKPKHVLLGRWMRVGANSFSAFLGKFAFTKPELLGFLRRVVPGFCACSPARVMARGGHRRGGGVGKKGGEGREGSAGKPLWQNVAKKRFRTALLKGVSQKKTSCNL